MSQKSAGARGGKQHRAKKAHAVLLRWLDSRGESPLGERELKRLRKLLEAAAGPVPPWLAAAPSLPALVDYFHGLVDSVPELLMLFRDLGLLFGAYPGSPFVHWRCIAGAPRI